MIPSLALEQELCRAYWSAREAFDADPFSEPKTDALWHALADMRSFIMADDGRPIEDPEHGVRFELDRNLEVQQLPISFGRFSGWARDGALAVSPAYQGA